MIKYGLKLWTNNETRVFEEARNLYAAGRFDFIELYYQPVAPIDPRRLELFDGLPVSIHAPHSNGFDELMIGDEQQRIWSEVVALADRFKSDVIVVHPGLRHTFDTFAKALKKIDDPRIRIENMPGQDRNRQEMFGQLLSDLKRIRTMKPICFDIEKAVKAAANQQLDYHVYIENGLRELTPEYFHISGGEAASSVDQHENLRNSTYDLAWVKRTLERYASERDIRLVFEVPKNKEDLRNDLENMEYFRSL